jgi:predicted outer membrane repeat protein
MKISRPCFFVLTLLFLSVFAATSLNAQPTTLFTVNHNGDSIDANVGDNVCADADGRCTLRAAIQEANFNPYQDGVNFALPMPSTIDLTLGELPVTSNIYIAGPGARNLTVQRSFAAGTPQFRIFKVQFAEASPIPLTIRGLTIKNGSTTSDGGAIFTDYGSTLQLFDVVITNNTASSGGGIFSAGKLVLTRSLVSSNTSTGLLGGGVANFNPQGTSIISNSTFTENSGTKGGAIYNSGALLLVNNTISHNVASDAGSSLVNESNGTVNILNTIIGMDINSAVSSLSGAFNSLGNNLITDARNSTGFSNGVNGDQVSDNNAINPLLGNLANNGGQIDTRALLDGSPAINHGSNCVVDGNCAQPVPPGFRLSSDQRIRYSRRSGTTVDVGAFEWQSGTIIGVWGFGTVGLRNRSGGAMVILTNASTNEKQTRLTNPFGSFSFTNLDFAEVYFVELKPKRSQQRSGLLVFALDSLPMLPQPNSILEREEIKITLPGDKDEQSR